MKADLVDVELIRSGKKKAHFFFFFDGADDVQRLFFRCSRLQQKIVAKTQHSINAVSQFIISEIALINQLQPHTY